MPRDGRGTAEGRLKRALVAIPAHDLRCSSRTQTDFFFVSLRSWVANGLRWSPTPQLRGRRSEPPSARALCRRPCANSRSRARWSQGCRRCSRRRQRRRARRRRRQQRPPRRRETSSARWRCATGPTGERTALVDHRLPRAGVAGGAAAVAAAIDGRTTPVDGRRRGEGGGRSAGRPDGVVEPQVVHHHAVLAAQAAVGRHRLRHAARRGGDAADGRRV